MCDFYGTQFLVPPTICENVCRNDSLSYIHFILPLNYTGPHKVTAMYTMFSQKSLDTSQQTLITYHITFVFSDSGLLQFHDFK